MMPLFLFLLFELTSKQQLYLLKQICPNCSVIGVIAVKDQSQEKAADLLKNSTYYNIKLEVEYVKKINDLSKGLQNLLDKKIEFLWIFDDSVNGDPMALRFLVTKTQENKIPIICGSEKQLQFGATYFFTINNEGQVVVKVKKASANALKLTLPEREDLKIEIVE